MSLDHRIARALGDAFAARAFGRADTLAILDAVLIGETAKRYTDYAGSTQAVMAADTLLTSLVAERQVDRAAAARARPALDRAYRAVHDPNTFRPTELRAALEQVARAAKALK